jgi:hypothetical protein
MSVSYSGAGTDIFIRKVKPGATVGVGYFFDVYENGVKIESTKIDTKKHVLQLIKDYKEKYHTDRAFQNELQVHITYKSKEERGEIAMQSLDQELLKKANNINIALQKLISPDLPIKIREAELAVGNVDFIPTTPGGTEGTMDENGIGTTIATKFVEFITGSQPQQGQEWIKSDNLYNPLKKWLTVISKKIKEFEQTNNTKLDRNKISDIAEAAVLSGDANLLKQKTQMQVSPEVAIKVKEIGEMKAGIRKPTPIKEKTQETAPQPLPVAASDNNIDLQKIAEELEDLTKTDEGFGQSSEEINFDKLLKSEEEPEEDLGSDVLGEESELEEKDRMEVATIDTLKKSFFDYVKNINKIASLEDAFASWSNKQNLEFIESKLVFSAINEDIMNDFSKEQSESYAEAINYLLGEVATYTAQSLSKIAKIGTESIDKTQLDSIANSVISDPIIQLSLSNFLYQYFHKNLENMFVQFGDIDETSVDKISLDAAIEKIRSNEFIKQLANDINNNFKNIGSNQFIGEQRNIAMIIILELSKLICIKLILALNTLFPKYKESFKTHSNGLPKLIADFKKHWPKEPEMTEISEQTESQE